MLRTVEATFDPASGVHLLEPVHVGKPVRVLVTFLETGDQTIPPHSGGTTGLDSWLSMPPAAVCGDTSEEMERYIKDLRTAWEQ